MSSVGKANIIIDAQNNASAELQKVQKDIKKISDEAKKSSKSIGQRAENNQSTFKKMAIGGGAVFGALSIAINKGINDLNEYESVTTRLGTILKTATGATDEQVRSLTRQAEAIEKVGVASKESIINAQAQLATFDLQTETIEKLTPAIVDYVIAEKGANASTAEFQQMTNSLAQALNGNFASLTKIGFVLDDNTKEMISNGTEMERAIALAGVLDSTYAGFNTTVASTAEGIKVLRDRELGALNENLATTFQPLIATVNETVIQVLTSINKWIGENRELADVLIKGAVIVSGMIAVLGTLGLVIPSIIAGFTAIKVAIIAISGPIGILVALLAGLAVYIYKNWGEIKAFWTEVGQSIASTTSEVWNSVYDTIAGIIDRVVSYVTDKFSKVTAVIQGVKNLGSSVISGVSKAVGIQARAKGGPVNGGQPYLVGEKGPELFVPGNSGKIIPNNKMGGGQGINLSFGNVIINNGKDERDFAMMVEQTITKAIRGQSLGYI